MVFGRNFFMSFMSAASDPISSGLIKNLSYRGDWVMLKIVDENGLNHCKPCPTDPAAFGKGACWISKNSNAQLSMILSAQAQQKYMHGRVIDLTSNCEIYQMTIVD